jgi:fibronectin-binding autotransporter adhesin
LTTQSKFSLTSGSATSFISWVNSAAGNAHSALFDGTAGTVSVASSGVTVSGLSFDVSGYTIQNNSIALSGSAPTIGVTSSGHSATISSALTGTPGLTKTGLGTLTLSGANTYNGATSVDAGKLVVATGGSISHSTSNFLVKNLAIAEVNGTVTASTVTINDGGTLTGTGTINANTTVNGTVNPGNSPGTLTNNGAFVLTSTSVLNFELNQADRTIGSGINDLIVVNGDLTLDGTLNVPGGTWTTNGTAASPLSWRLFTFSGFLTDNGLTLGTLPTLTGTPAPQEWKLEVVTNQVGGGYVNLNAVPEPSFALLLGGVLAGTVSLRRNRRSA